jgi:glycolate oxidase iron-sulfur subunit
MCKEYGHLLADDPAWAARAASFSAKVRDVHELLVPVAPDVPGVPDTAGRATAESGPLVRRRVAYDAPCHLQHGQRVVAQPPALLRSLDTITLVPLTDSDQCCGSAGIFSLIRPEVAGLVLAPKLDRIRESGADVVATGNPGCLMQIGGGLVRQGRGVVARHPIELLDEYYARASARR